jgi:hypothetical protein
MHSLHVLPQVYLRINASAQNVKFIILILRMHLLLHHGMEYSLWDVLCTQLWVILGILVLLHKMKLNLREKFHFPLWAYRNYWINSHRVSAHCCSGTFTEPLPSNGQGATHTDTVCIESGVSNSSSIVAAGTCLTSRCSECIHCHGNIYIYLALSSVRRDTQTGLFELHCSSFQVLKRRIHRHTARWLQALYIWE